MATKETNHKKTNKFRKIIDLKTETKTILTLQATVHNMTLKGYIESILENVADDEEDKYLLSLAKQGDQTILNPDEKAAFKKKLAQYF